MRGRKPDRPRDAHLSLRWESRDGWGPVAAALGREDAPETLSAVALALYIEASGFERSTSYSRRPAHYALPHRYRSRLYTYTRVLGAVDWLDGQGLIDHAKANPGQRGWQSTMRATPDLVDLVQDALHSDVTVRMPPESVILRDADKHPIEYRETRETRRIRCQIEAQNEAIKGEDLGGDNVLQINAPVRRIFNEKLSLGGRFYAEGGGWQTLTKVERLRLRIGGEPVVEVDYSQFHPTLAYAQAGHPVPREAYDVPGFDRELVKVAFAVMLNSSSRNGARYTIAHKPGMVRMILGDDIPSDLRGEKMWHWAARLDPGYAQTASRQAELLIDRLMQRHAPISGMFFIGIGLTFQRLDSDIAEAVMKEMRHRGIVVLPVHDSFLAPASKADVLEEVMVAAAAKLGAAVVCTCSSTVPTG